jgi:putative peptidoglycan lipid II flippase
MSNSSLAKTLSARQLQLASLLIGSSFILSGGLGVLRGAIINSTFGAGSDLDAFFAAFRVPETLFTLVAGGALGAAFIPVYSRFLTANDADGAARLANAVLTLVTLTAAGLAALAAILAPMLVATFLSRDSAPDQQALIVALMRPMLITVVIFAASGLMMGMLNANQRFLAPALAPSFYNLGLILGAVFLTPALGVFGLAWGAVIGALLHLGVQLPTLREVGFRLRPSLAWQTAGAGEVFWLMAPRILGQGVTQINFWVNTTLASGMAAGSLTALTTAFTLMFTALGVLGQSVGTAVFPTLSMQHAQGDTEAFRRTLANALRSVLFTTIPAGVGLIVVATPLIATIYEHGQWTSAATMATAWALGFFALGLPAFGLQEILARSFYAIKDTRTPVTIAVLGVILNVALSVLLIRVVQGADPAQGPFGGLALANALATVIESAALWWLLRRRVGSLHDAEVLALVGRALIAALAMGVVVYAVDQAVATLPPLIRLIVGAGVGAAVYEGIGLLLGLPEARSVPAALLRRVRR